MSKMKLKRPKKTANDAKCEYRYDGNKHTAENKEDCDKLKAEMNKYLKDNHRCHLPTTKKPSICTSIL